jgi:hypothetical protein
VVDVSCVTWCASSVVDFVDVFALRYDEELLRVFWGGSFRSAESSRVPEVLSQAFVFEEEEVAREQIPPGMNHY